MATQIVFNAVTGQIREEEWSPEPPSLEALPDLKARLKAEIDRAAEVERRKYITPGSGQAMTYMQKATEATACLADENPLSENYPFLAAEIGITAETLVGVAQIVFAAHQGWRQIGAAIEALRRSGKETVSVAETVEAAQIAAQIIWPGAN